ncbi:MAG: ATP-binding protein [Pontixanthobacter sp.]
MSDPLGKQPMPATGKPTEDFTNRGLLARVDAANEAFANIWIKHEPQEAIIARLRAYIAKTRGIRGKPIGGCRFSQETQAGKSSTIERLAYELAQERIARGQGENPYQVLIVTCEEKMALKTWYQEVLRQMGDAYFDEEAPGKGPKRDERTMKLLEDKIAKWSKRLKVDLLAVDEVQRLRREKGDSKSVTERLQTFLDRGIVSIVMIGNDKSEDFFSENKDLAGRLGRPLTLKPLNTAVKQDAKLFQDFCRSFDDELVKANIFPARSGLSKPGILDPLQAATGGHVGRVARLIEEAMPLAIMRGAASIEAYDLSVVTRELAIFAGWTSSDPFSTPFSK